MADRVDEHGAACAGSQLQTQLYVNRRALDDAIRAAFPCLARAMFDWRSPLADDHYAEYSEAAFLRRLNHDEHVDALAKFWPSRGGPHWDALAVVTLPHEPNAGVMLAEGKSYPDEMLRGLPLGLPTPIQSASSRTRSRGRRARLVSRSTSERGPGLFLRTPTGSPTSTGCAPAACPRGSFTCCSSATGTHRRMTLNGRRTP